MTLTSDAPGREVVVRVDSEGATFTLYRTRSPGREHEYFVELNQALLFDLVERLDGEAIGEDPVTRSRGAKTLEDGLRLLDTEPFWVSLHPVAVHPGFAERILAAVEERLLRNGRGEERVRRSLERWRSVCEAARSR